MKKHLFQTPIKFCIVILFFSFSTSVYTQQLPPARVSTFTYSPGVSPKEADEIGRMVEAYFTNAGRFDMITSDRTAIDEELDRQKDGIYLNGHMVEQNKAKGARYLVVGHLLNTEGGLDYATIQLGLVDVETGENVAVETLSPTGRDAATLIMATDEADDALEQDHNYRNDTKLDFIEKGIKILSKKRIEKNVKDFLDEHFPMTFVITKMEEDGSKITNIELYGYKAHQFRRHEVFKVVQRTKEKMPDNSMATREVEIATIKVVEVQGDLAKCKVNKQEQTKLFDNKDAEGITVIKK